MPIYLDIEKLLTSNFSPLLEKLVTSDFENQRRSSYSTLDTGNIDYDQLNNIFKRFLEYSVEIKYYDGQLNADGADSSNYIKGLSNLINLWMKCKTLKEKKKTLTISSNFKNNVFLLKLF